MQARFAMVKSPAKLWNNGNISDVMTACIILHNMIVEDKRGEDLGYDYEGGSTRVSVSRYEVHRTNEEFREAFSSLKDNDAHNQLQHDLMRHLWNRRAEKKLVPQ